MAVKLVLSFSSYDNAELLNVGFAKLGLKYTLNTGINFGLAAEATKSRQFLLAGIALVISLCLIIFASNGRVQRSVAIGLFAGGGVANAFERLAYGGVFDYLNASLVYLQNPFAFNLADIYISIGAIMLLFQQYKR